MFLYIKKGCVSLNTKDMTYLMLLTISICPIIIRKLNDEKLNIYKNIQKNIILYVFIYLLSICLISNQGGTLNAIKPIHVLVSYLIIIILPLILLPFSHITFLKTDLFKKDKLIKILNFIVYTILIFSLIYIFLNKNNYKIDYLINLLIFINSILYFYYLDSR